MGKSLSQTAKATESLVAKYPSAGTVCPKRLDRRAAFRYIETREEGEP